MRPRQIVPLLLVILALPIGAAAEEFWVIADARLKGDDYLFVLDPEKPKPPYRRLRCRVSLPLYVEEMAKAAERVKGSLVLRVRAQPVAEPSGESVEEVRILMVTLLPKESWAALAKLKDWKSAEPLPDEIMKDPFQLND
jgi:hypothetical protein